MESSRQSLNRFRVSYSQRRLAVSVARKFQEKVSLVGTMADVPDKAGHEMTVGAASLLCLRPCFSLLKNM
jgi:hypothetical protein